MKEISNKVINLVHFCVIPLQLKVIEQNFSLIKGPHDDFCKSDLNETKFASNFSNIQEHIRYTQN